MKKDNKKKFNPNNNPFLKNKQLPNYAAIETFKYETNNIIATMHPF